MGTRHVVAMAALVFSACKSGSATATSPSAQSIPRDAARFEIDAVDDSTARFRPKESRWVRPGMAVYAVDPMRRDAIVARMRVLSAEGESVTALVTSQVARVNTSHVLLIARDVAPWWRARTFWWGAAAGGAVGAAATGLTR